MIEIADKLFPVIDSGRTVGVKPQYDRSYRRSYRWNFQTGDFERTGANHVEMCDGLEAYHTWCIKAVATERKKCLAYPSEIGAEMVAAFRKPSQKAQESAIKRTIKETLMTNPRTEYVRDFSFSWNSDSVEVSFTVKGVDYDSFRVTL